MRRTQSLAAALSAMERTSAHRKDNSDEKGGDAAARISGAATQISQPGWSLAAAGCGTGRRPRRAKVDLVWMCSPFQRNVPAPTM